MEIRILKNSTDILPDPLPSSFHELSLIHQLRPIRDNIDYDNATAIVDRLALMPTRTQDQEDYLETLSELISKYDDQHHFLNTDPITPVESLKYLMTHNQITTLDLCNLLKEDTSIIRDILSGKQELKKEHIRILSEKFKVSPSLFF